MQKPIVVVGSINLDLVAGTDRFPQAGETVIGNSFNTFYGGKGANQAVGVAKLGYPVYMVGNVGADSFGTQLRNALNDAGVNTSFVKTVDGASGVALIATDARGQNNIIVVPGANAQLTPQMLENALPVLRTASFLLAQLEIPLETVEYLAELSESHNIPLMLDPAPARELSPALLRKVCWLTPNETETKVLFKSDQQDVDHLASEAVAHFRACGVKNVLIKMGSRGCIVSEAASSQLRVPAFSVDAVDATAAGDAFNAAFAVGLLLGQTSMQSAVFASAAAAISVTRAGAQPSMPTLAEVEKFLETHSRAVR